VLEGRKRKRKDEANGHRTDPIGIDSFAGGP